MQTLVDNSKRGRVMSFYAIYFKVWRRLRSLVRSIYIRLGVLPEIAAGIQAASALQHPPED